MVHTGSQFAHLLTCSKIGNDEHRKKDDNCPPSINGDGVCVVLNRGITRHCTNGGTFSCVFELRFVSLYESYIYISILTIIFRLGKAW